MCAWCRKLASERPLLSFSVYFCSFGFTCLALLSYSNEIYVSCCLSPLILCTMPVVRSYRVASAPGHTHTHHNHNVYHTAKACYFLPPLYMFGANFTLCQRQLCGPCPWARSLSIRSMWNDEIIAAAKLLHALKHTPNRKQERARKRKDRQEEEEKKRANQQHHKQ